MILVEPQPAWQPSPNPTSDQLHIVNRHTDFIPKPFKWQLHDMQGRLVQHQNISLSSRASQSIHVSDISDGLYMATLYNNEGHILKSERIVINNSK